VDTILQALRNLGPLRLTIMGAIVLGLLGFFIFLTTKLATPQLELLYGSLEMEDSARIVSNLEGQKIPFEIRGNGAQIYVPSDQVLRLRVTMAERGIPGGGSVGYEIFDTADSLGTTNFVQNVNLVRALEGELARTISALDVVRKARVHLVLPKRELFSREKQQPSASIILKLSRGQLAKRQVQAIQHLVAAAVPGLLPNHISVVDEKGNLLAEGFEDAGGAGSLSAKSDERRTEYQNRLSRTIEKLLEKTVGPGNVRAEVTVDMDFDRISTNEEKFDPDGQVVRSTQSIEEQASSKDAEATPPVSVGTNLPDATANAGESVSSSNTESRTEETVNFEISKKIVNHIRESGTIKRISVAVLVNGVTRPGPEGDPVYEPRKDAEMELLATLVRSSIGFNADRGDSVDVINMRFTDVSKDVEEELELFFGLDKNDLLRMAEILVLSIVAILVILLVVRPLVSRAFEAMPAVAGAAGEAGALLAEQAQAALTAPSAPGEPGAEGEDMFDELIDIDRVEGRVKASSVKKVGEIIGKHPEEALAIVRSWMYQGE